MTGRIIKFLSLSLCALLLCGALTACGGDGGGTEDTSDTSAVSEALPLESYRIICRTNYSDGEMETANSLRKLIGEATGVWLEVTTDFEREGTDFVRTDYEILVGKTNREESQSVADKFYKNRDYGIYKPSTRIAIIAGSDEALKTATEVFAEKYISSGELRIDDGEAFEYMHTYGIAELKLDGNDIKDYVIVYTNGDSVNAALLQGMISERVGYDLKIQTATPVSAKYIRIKNDTASNKSLYASWKLSNGILEFSAGKYANVKSAVEDFAQSYLVTSAETVGIETGASASVSAATDKLFIASEDYLASIDARADARKQAIMNSTPDLSKVTATKYYVSNNGNDANDGKSPETAWATLSKVNSSPMSSKAAVLFECGGEWRGQLVAKKGVTYASYGTGAKPVIIGSAKNYADSSLWEETDAANVYKYKASLKGAGNIAFIDGDTVTMGSRLLRLKKENSGSATLTVIGDTYKDLNTDLQYIVVYANDKMDDGTVYVYSNKGNPGTRFSRIEIGEKANAVAVADGATFDGIEVRYTGAHGFGGNADNVTIRNCAVQYVGGSLMADHVTPYGNAIEIYGECEGFTVENNYINEIYDTGITFQMGSSTAGDCEYKNIRFSGNLIERCHWSIEFYNQPKSGTVRSVKNVEITDNICRYAGMGWASKFRTAENGYFLNETRANHICSWGLDENVENFVISGNIFEYIDGFTIRMNSDTYGPGDKKISITDNTYIMSGSAQFAKIGSTYQYIGDFTRDSDPTIAIIE